MSTTVNYPWTVTNNSITVTKDGEPFTVFSSQENFLEVKDAIKVGDWERVFLLMDPIEYIEKAGDGRISVKDGDVYVTDDDGLEFKVPSDLGDTIQLYIEEELPLMPLVNFSLKLNKNPSYRSVQQLFGFIKANSVTLTEDGNFIAYKGVREDFKDSYTGTMDNSVGQVVRMQRNQVNEDPNQTCSYGLHVAAYDYAHTYYGAGCCGVTLVVEVSPEHVVAVPTDYNNAKMRVCEYKVIGTSKGERIAKPLLEKTSEVYECDCDCCGDSDDDGETCSWPDYCDCQACVAEQEEEENCTTCDCDSCRASLNI